MYDFEIKRGDILYVDFGHNNVGSVQNSSRYAICLSNNQNNKYSTTIQVAPFTSQSKAKLPVHIIVEPTKENGLKKTSTLMLEQLRVISKIQVDRRVGHIDDEDLLREIDLKILKQLGISVEKLIK